MLPRWLRRALFLGALGFGALVFATVAKPEACASIWTWEAHQSPCCAIGSQHRWTKPGGDCCDFAGVDQRDPAASGVPIVVPPAQWTRVAVVTAPMPATARLDADRTIPERPPDRSLTTTILLI
jgi:hypothetical protein